MGTPNFARPSNASKYYVVLTGREVNYKECTECETKYYEHEGDYDELKSPCCKQHWGEVGQEYRYPKDFECDDLVSNIGYEIKRIGGTPENESIGNDRSHYIQSLGILEEEKTFGDIWVRLRVTAVLQSAYYEGATLDYLVHLDCDCDTYDISTGSCYDTSIEEAIQQGFETDYSDMNKGMLKIQSKNAVKWAERTLEELSDKLEGIFEEWSEHKLGCTGVFSNGEAIYHKVD